MITSLIILIISLLLDGILSNLLPFSPYQLSWFTPLLTVTSLTIVYCIMHKKINVSFWISLIIIGIMYDISYTNLILWHSLVFSLLIIVIKFIFEKILTINYWTYLLVIIVTLFLYEALNVALLSLFQLKTISLTLYLDKTVHSILLNVIYGSVLYLFYKLKVARS